MRIQHKVLLIVLPTLLGLLAAVYGLSRAAVAEGFGRVEDGLIRRDAARARTAVESLGDDLSAKLSDWAAWDDAHRFVQDANPAFIEANISPGTLVDLRLSAMLFLALDGSVVYAVGVDKPAGRLTDPPPALKALIAARHPVLSHAAADSEKHGIYAPADGSTPLVVASRPITNTARTVEPRGTLVWISPLDRDAIDAIAADLVIDVAVRRLSAGERPPDQTQVDVLDDERIAASLPLTDLDGLPALSLTVKTHRPVRAQSRATLNYFIGSLVAAGAVFTLALTMLLGRVVTSPVEDLDRQVRELEGDHSARLVPRGRDELAHLAAAVNRLLDRIAESQLGLRESERRSRALAESNAKFRAMFDSSPVAIALCNEQGRVLEANPDFLALAGVPQATAAPSLWDLVPTDAAHALAALTRSGAPGQRLAPREADIRTPDGRLTPAIINAVLLDVEPGQRRLWLFAEDISDRVDAERRLERFAADLVAAKAHLEDQARQLQAHARQLDDARAQAEAASRAKGEFLANMSHEIRTPMTAILGYAELLSEPGLNDDQRAKHAHTIRSSGEHLLTIINDILDLSKIEAGKMTVERTPCSPVRIARDVQGLLALRASEKGLDLRLETPTPLPSAIRSDPIRLRQVLVNLVGNAVKFTERGSVTVRLTADRQAAFLRIDVKDTGVGISPAERQRLFRPFTQADASTTRRFGGTGLGLTISKRLVEMLGGEITLDSAPGVGTTFTLTLPLTDPDALTWTTPEEPRHAAHDDAARARPPATATDLTAVDVLVAEDGADNQRLITHHLTRAGARVHVVDNGAKALDEALRAARDARPYRVILMDMQMPEMDGYTAAATLRRRGYKGPIIALTAHAMAEDRSRCLSAGCDDYLVKPIDRRALVEACARWAAGQAPTASPSNAAPAKGG